MSPENTRRFIFNAHGDNTAVVHHVECPTVQHQVRGDILGTQGRNRNEALGVDAEGNRVYAEKFEQSPVYSHARYVTDEWLQQYPHRFRPCRVCAPDVTERPPADRRAIKVESLRANHIGKCFVGLGRLLEVRITEKSYLLIGDSCTTEFEPGSVTEYFK